MAPERGVRYRVSQYFFRRYRISQIKKKTVSKFPILVISNIKISFYRYKKFTTLIPNLVFKIFRLKLNHIHGILLLEISMLYSSLTQLFPLPPPPRRYGYIYLGFSVGNMGVLIYMGIIHK